MRATTGNKQASTQDVLGRTPSGLLVPVREVKNTAESICLGFRQEMVSMGEEEDGGRVLVGAGVGTDFIILEWDEGNKEHQAVVRGSEVLKAWLHTFLPDTAARIPGELVMP